MSRQPAALIVDDEPDIRELLAITLKRMDIDSEAAATTAEARQKLKRMRFDLCLTDMRLPDGSGLDLVAHIQSSHPNIPVAVITAHGNMESAIQALKNGAFDFVTKPVDLAVLRRLVETALKLNEQRQETRSTLIGESAVVHELRAKIAKLARSQAPIHISGESGTGKDLVARMIHEQGPRAGQAFVPVNCGAIPHDLIESELFGHKKGSFTGALSDKPGLFQAAHGGTLFLDEVADLPLVMQVKLLRAVQERAVRPVGAQSEVKVDVRVLSATHKDLEAMVKNGEFRQDLYYRINVIEVRVAPLRERPEDIALLVQHILSRLAQSTGVAAPALAEDAMLRLRGCRFPGNVRELENILERALALCEGGAIRAEDLQLKDAETSPLASLLDNIEREKILTALEQAGGNKTAAARLLGISFRSLRYRLRKFGLKQPTN
ncbi:MAG: sigma-54-dependent transcriptional regulator [Chromatiales bacterium]